MICGLGLKFEILVLFFFFFKIKKIVFFVYKMNLERYVFICMINRDGCIYGVVLYYIIFFCVNFLYVFG